jgi:Ni,Fe-hydrogenase I large subunit
LTIKTLIEQIEGEASIYFDIENGVVDFATVVFPHFRGMETILENKSAMDALVITPRVCGICGHAHLMATVRALEDAYNNAGHSIELTNKAFILREFTLIMEMLQNHYKWLTMTIIPEVIKLTQTPLQNRPLIGAYGASLISKAIALFGGQWPHSSYMVPGGITSDPTHIEILQAQNYLDEFRKFFEKETLGIDSEKFLAFESCKEFNNITSDISYLEEALIRLNMHQKGFGHDRFLVMGKHTFASAKKLKHTRPFNVDKKYIHTKKSYAPEAKTFAKNALYKGDYYETGPLARMMAASIPLLKNMHRRYKDSAYSRIMARVYEMAYMINHAQTLLKQIDPSETSVSECDDIKKVTAEGVGIVEAPRGPLIHRIKLEKGIIRNYEIITPTQFNISSDTKEHPTPVQLAMNGTTKEEALFIFRTFDVCSVCTTH